MFKGSRSTFFALVTIWAFQIFGAIGILFWNREWFTNMTPFTLLLYFIILYNKDFGNHKKVFFLLLTFTWGIFSEIIGVNTGLIFGSYEYGKTLGFQVLNVPMAYPKVLMLPIELHELAPPPPALYVSSALHYSEP